MILDLLQNIDFDSLNNYQKQDIVNALWHTGELDYKLHSGQQIILNTLKNTSYNQVLIFCARRWGKSFVTCTYALAYALVNPKCIVRIAAPTYDQASDIVNDIMAQLLDDCPKGLVTYKKADKRYVLHNKAQIRLGILEKAHVDSLRGGGNANLVICEEGGSVKSDDYKYAVRSVLGPQLARTRGKLIHVTTPSEEPEHYIHSEVLHKCEYNNTLFRFDIYSNPQLEQDQIDEIAELAGGYGSVEWEREFLCKIVRDSGRVCLPNFDEETMTTLQEPPDFCEFNITIDFGGVRDKTVTLVSYYDYKIAKLIIMKEFVYNSSTPTSRIIPEVESFMKEFIQLNPPDPFSYNIKWTIKHRHADAAGQLLIDIHKNFNVNYRLPHKDDWEASINQLNINFDAGKILVHKDCKFTIQTCKGATFNKNRTDFDRSDFLGHMDALATLMYANRMADRQSNPYPKLRNDFITGIYPYESKESESNHKQVSKLITGKRR